MIITIVILAMAAFAFATGKVRSDIVALCSMLAMLALGIIDTNEALAGFSNPVVVMMVGLFVVGGAVLRTGLARIISRKIMVLARGSELLLFLLVMLTAAAIGAFVSNTGTVALMLPIVVSMAAHSKTSASRLLMPLAFASSMGGMLTLIGTPPNLVIQESLSKAHFQEFGFFSFFPVGLICLTVGILVLLPLSKWLLSRNDDNENDKQHGKSLDDLVEEYQLSHSIARYKVIPQSLVKEKTLAELDIRHRYDLTVIEIREDTSRQPRLMQNVSQHIPGPATRLHEGNIMYLAGNNEDMERFAYDCQLRKMTSSKGVNSSHKPLDFYDIGIAEILLLPSSRLLNMGMRQSGFRESYGVNVLGIRRKGEYIVTDLAEQKFRSGDVLLVQGTWSNIALLEDDSDDWVVMGQPLEQAEHVTLDYKAPYAAVVMLLMVAMMVFDFIPVAPVTAVLIAAVLMVMGGCFKNVEAAYKTINWESVVLIAAMMPMSVALEKTGASALVSQSLVSGLGALGPTALLAGIYVTTSFMTMFISNTATAVLMAPIAMVSSTQLGCNPYPFLLAVSVAASMCFASPFSTPPNALVMQAGQYKFMDYVKVGLPLQVIMGIVMVLTLPLLFPFH